MSNTPKLDLHDSASSLLIFGHYAEVGVGHGWDRDRVIRLCRLLNCTPTELARFCCCFYAPTKGEMPSMSPFKEWWRENHFPPVAALHFALLESWILEVLAASRGEQLNQKPVMPVGLLIKPSGTEIPHHD